MDLDSEFLKLANKIRMDIMEIDGEILKEKQSIYNNDLYG